MLSPKRLIPVVAGMAIVMGVLVLMKISGMPASTSDFSEAEEFTGIVQWLNSEPLRLEELRGRVVLLDFWTYSCINCVRTLPYQREWNHKYSSRGLTIVGVHSPEFAFEKAASNVRQAIVREGIAWPVAMDNDFATWYAYGTRWWPHKFLIDQKGDIRYQHLGERAYRETKGQSFLVVATRRLYNVIRGSEVATHELRFSAASLDLVVYSFTFGPRTWSWTTLDKEQWPEK